MAVLDFYINSSSAFLDPVETTRYFLHKYNTDMFNMY